MDTITLNKILFLSLKPLLAALLFIIYRTITNRNVLIIACLLTLSHLVYRFVNTSHLLSFVLLQSMEGSWFSNNWIQVLSPLVAAFAAWFFTRRRQKAETKVVEGDAVKGMQDAYATFVKDSEAKHEERAADMEEIMLKMQQLETREDDLKQQIEETLEKLEESNREVTRLQNILTDHNIKF